MLLLKAIPARVTAEGRIEKGNTMMALFRDNHYETSDPEVNALIREASSFGVEIWDADEQDQAAAVAEYEAFATNLKKHPHLLQRLKKDINRKDFAVIEALAGSDAEQQSVGGDE